MQGQELSSQLDMVVRSYVLPMAWKLIGALAIWLGGRVAIRIFRTGLRQTMKARRLDVTLARYLDTGATAALQVIVLIAVLGVLGVETTSFAALLAAAGIAIGAAWSGLLSNFAAGLFLLTFRPFKVGDTIAAAGVTGRVREIGLFVTAIDTQDNVLTYVGNNRLFSENVQNFSANDCRRVDLTAQLPPGTDVDATISRLRAAVLSTPRVLPSPEPVVEILSFNPQGCLLVVRPFCRSEDYSDVYFNGNRMISHVLNRDQFGLRAS